MLYLVNKTPKVRTEATSENAVIEKLSIVFVKNRKMGNYLS